MTGGNTGGNQAGSFPVKRTGRFGDDKDPNLGEETRFKKGQSGNPKGRAKGKALSKTIQDMLGDENFIERLADALPEDMKKPDPEYQGTPMKAIIATALIEPINPASQPKARQAARDWLAN